MSMRGVIVDDTDPSIKYLGKSWKADEGSRDTVGNYGSPFRSTLHRTDSSASLSFHFSGTLITVYGSNTVRNNSGVFNPQWECFIDNKSIGASKPYAYPENNWTFCSSPSLMDGPHTLTMNISIKNEAFWFDCLEYTPSPTVSLENSNIRIKSDDTELQFGEGWNLGGDVNLTQTKGAVFEFEFTGISVSLFSWSLVAYPRKAASGIYTINGSSPQTFNVEGLPDDAAYTAHHQKVFETPTLPMGRHNLSVIYNGDKETTPLTFQYLIVKNGTDNNVDTHGPTPTSIVPIPTINTPAPTHMDLVPTAKLNIGAIAGGLISAAGAVIIFILVLIFLRRGQKSRGSNIPIAQFEPSPRQSIYQWSHRPSAPAWDSPNFSESANAPYGPAPSYYSNIASSSDSSSTRPPTYFSNQPRLSVKATEIPQQELHHHSGMDDAPPRLVRHIYSGTRNVHSSSEDSDELPPRYIP